MKKKTKRVPVRVTEKEMKQVSKMSKILKVSKAEAYRVAVNYWLSTPK